MSALVSIKERLSLWGTGPPPPPVWGECRAGSQVGQGVHFLVPWLGKDQVLRQAMTLSVVSKVTEERDHMGQGRVASARDPRGPDGDGGGRRWTEEAPVESALQALGLSEAFKSSI